MSKRVLWSAVVAGLIAFFATGAASTLVWVFQGWALASWSTRALSERTDDDPLNWVIVTVILAGCIALVAVFLSGWDAMEKERNEAKAAEMIRTRAAEAPKATRKRR